jgi:PKD repeat protein
VHSRISLCASFLSVLLAMVSSAGSVAWAQTNDKGESFPQQVLTRVGRGADIPALLGSRLPQVAAWYGRTEAELRALCQKEQSLRADPRGRLHYVCEGLLPLQNAVAQAGTASGTGTAAASFPASETFFLHSKPGATKVIYLDFDGHTTSGTYWNSEFTAGANIVTPPYSTDSTVTTAFSATELANIQDIWRRVAEDYAPFDVDVTTQDPGVEGLRKTTSSDLYFGVRVCIGGSSYDWLGGSAGGIAYLNSFAWSTDTPCFVFPAQLGNGSAKYTAEATSHEAGHTFNLNHDGKSGVTEYYQGHSNWAPIMGVGYYRAVTHWSKGEYTGATNLQDDTAIIASVCPWSTDAHGDSIVNATPLTGTALTAGGIIEKRTDADLFSFTTGTGPVSFTVTPDSPSPNLDVQLALYDGLGNLVASAAPTETLDATLSTTLATGTYYIAVDGVGTGDATTAYNDYGSLGQFSLSGSTIPVGGQPPVAVADSSAPTSGIAPLAVTFSSTGSFDPDGAIASYDWDFGDGGTSTLASPVHSYAAAGTYTASLVVVDNSGLSSPADTVTIVVQQGAILYVANIAMTLSSSSKGYQATATVTVRDQNGNVRSGATVAGSWSGLTSGSASKSTNTSGNAVFTSTRTKTRGTFVFTVTGITRSGYTYSPGTNVETTDSISTP